VASTLRDRPGTNGAAVDRGQRGGGRGGGGRRQVPLVVVGVLLVLGCALVFAEVSLRAGKGRELVLVTSRPLAAGQTVSAGDLRSVAVSTGSDLQVILTGQAGSVVGRPVAVPLAAGALLTFGELGAAVPSGDVVAVGLKPGGYPPDLTAGDRVQVVPVTPTSTSGSGSAGGTVTAVVLSVQAGSDTSGGPTVFSLQVSANSAARVARLAAAGDASLVQIGAGR
jgi:hypothetical protein